MGLGIGKNCKYCTKQLNYEDGFNHDETVCDPCEAKKKMMKDAIKESLEEDDIRNLNPASEL